MRAAARWWGAADVIEKPINREELMVALRRTLSARPRRILIVDDQPDDRDLLSSYLEDEGAEIRTASDGREALRMLEAYTPDLVLLDLLMPNLDGIAVIKRLNEMEPYRSIPIVVVTAKDLTAGGGRGTRQVCPGRAPEGARGSRRGSEKCFRRSFSRAEASSSTSFGPWGHWAGIMATITASLPAFSLASPCVRRYCGSALPCSDSSPRDPPPRRGIPRRRPRPRAAFGGHGRGWPGRFPAIARDPWRSG
jgi:CheY-like chemotaxis protein